MYEVLHRDDCRDGDGGEPHRFRHAAHDHAVGAAGGVRFASLNGRSIPDQGPQITLSIVGEKYQQAVDGKVTERGTLKLDASKQPMTIDLAITEGDGSGKAQIGIVEVTDGTLRMCLDTPGAGQRPSEFGVKDGVIVFEARKNEP